MKYIFLFFVINLNAQTRNYSKEWFHNEINYNYKSKDKIILDEVMSDSTYYSKNTLFQIAHLKGMKYFYYLDYRLLKYNDTLKLCVEDSCLEILNVNKVQKNKDSVYSLDTNFLENNTLNLNNFFSDYNNYLEVKLNISNPKSKVKFIIYAKKENFLQDYIVFPNNELYYCIYNTGFKNITKCRLNYESSKNDFFITDLGYKMSKFEYDYAKYNFIYKKIFTNFEK